MRPTGVIRSRPARALASAAITLAGLCGTVRTAADPAAEIIRQLDTGLLQPGPARAVHDLELRAGPGTLHVRDGLLFAASEVGGRVVEFVLIADATLRIDPPDQIEAAQLELFTGRPFLDEPVREVVLAVCADEAVDRLLAQAPAVVDEPARRRAERLFDAWRSSPERRHLQVGAGIFRDALGDPSYEGFFAARFGSDRLGDFLLVVDPDAIEPVVLGQFVPLRGGDREQRRRERYIHRQQRRGRLIGLELDDLGKWNTWMSTRTTGPDDVALGGRAPFEAEHYRLDVSIDDEGREVRGTARLRVRALDGGRRVVKIETFSDVVVTAVRDAAGRDLVRFAERDAVYAVLVERPIAGAAVELEIDFEGVLIDRVQSNVYRLRDTTRWYPHVGEVDRATYDVIFRYPRHLDLVAGGHRVGGGRDGPDRRWERRVLDMPAVAFSFEIGHFDRRRLIVGHVDVVVAFDRASRRSSRHVRNEIVRAVKQSLEFYEETFGPYPLDFLTVVTAPRDFSQGLLGFVSLSSQLVREPRNAFWLGIEDRRTVVAHEIAHQWWGNLVGWRSYRDEWMSEALASYSAMVWARTLPGGRRPQVGPADQWQAELTRTMPDGRPVEATGPLVLGRRLSSSRAPEAYEAIVYKKGAVVLNMLNHYFGETLFLRMLGELVRVSQGRLISTEEFFRSIEEMTSLDLDWFTRQYVYGTGLPEVYYSYEFIPQPGGTWRIRGEVRQRTPLHYSYRVVSREQGGYDIRRDAEEALDVSESRLVVPVKIPVYEPRPGTWASGSGVRDQRSRRRRPPDGALVGRLLQKDEFYEFEVEIGYEPAEFQLDPEGVVFGKFFSEHASPKRALMYRGFDAAAAGDPREAEQRFLEALEARVSSEEPPNHRIESFLYDWEERYLEASIHANLAWLYMDEGRLEEARVQLRMARTGPDDFTRERIAGSLDILEARLDILLGEYQRPYRLLSRELLEPRDPLLAAPEIGRTDGYLLLAIAARALGEEDDFRRAATVAERRGADVTAFGDR